MERVTQEVPLDKDADILQTLKRTVLNLDLSGLSFSTSCFQNDYQMEVYFPRGSNEFRDFIAESPQTVLCVGFFGTKKSNISPADDQQLWHDNQRLISELQNHTNIMLYVSAKLRDGNWGNLVLLSDPNGISKWNECPSHDTVVSSLAPRVYTKVRIHRGAFPDGLQGKLQIYRTLLVQYEDNKMASRNIITWSE